MATNMDNRARNLDKFERRKNTKLSVDKVTLQSYEHTHTVVDGREIDTTAEDLDISRAWQTTVLVLL